MFTLNVYGEPSMTSKLPKRKVCLTGLTAIAMFMSISSASAAPPPLEDIQPISPLISTVEILPPEPVVERLSQSGIESPALQDREVDTELAAASPSIASDQPTSEQAATLQPLSASVDSAQPASEATPLDAAPETRPEDTRVAQTVVRPGRATRSGPSYLGIAGNIGLGGDTTLGDSGLAVISKIGLTRNLSARPSVVIGDNDPAIVLPVTVDFPISSVLETGELNLEAAPYIGGGIAISTGSDSLVRPVISAGIDVPVADRVTATAGVNFAFFDDTEIGLILGAGYRF
jgi:hypothetical protein